MKKIALLLVFLILLPMIAGCTALGASNTQGTAQAAAQTAQEQQLSVESIQSISVQELSPMAVIMLNGTSAAAEGEGVTIDGAAVTITKGGSYTLSGALTDGTIVVDAGKKETVELILNGVSISSSTGAAIDCKQAQMTIVTLAEGTENSLRDASAYVYAAASEDEPNAALFARDDLLIRGTGSLDVQGNFQNGVVSKDNLVIESGIIAVEAVNNGLRGKDSVSVLGGAITITAGNDGIQADNEGSGAVLIEGGSIDITSAHDGIQAASALTVSGGEIQILAGGGYTTESYSSEESYKALKSAGALLISGGIVSVNSLDDAIHAAKSVTVSGGTLTLLSRDDGIHADETLNVTGGTIDIQICYEGLESAVVNISGGTVRLLSADDGINAADPNASGQGDRMGNFGGMNAGDSSLQVNITGGYITINAYGDGIDSNGSVTMSGGELYITGPLSSGNGALDYDSSFVMSGGALAAAGSVGMAQTPGQNSTQPSVIVYFSQSQSAGNSYLLTDASGTVLLSITPEKDFQCIVFSAPEMKTGSGYAVYESGDGTLANATRLYDFTISGIITSVGGTDAQTRQNNWMQQPQQQRRP
jgi:hypothetical protein